jgi:hypothetical protein
MKYSAQKLSLLLLVFLGIIFIPIGQSLATNVDFTDSESTHCYGCEDPIEQVRDHCDIKDCVQDSCLGSCSVTLYFNAPVLVYSLVRAKTLVYWNSPQFHSQISAPLYRPPIA